MIHRKKLLDALSDKGERVFELQSVLTSFRALGPDNGGDGEACKSEFLEKYLLGLGKVSVEHADALDSRVSSGIRPNIIARIPGRTSRMLWVLGHLDVVPAGDESLWETDPWTVVRDAEDNDVIRGRGVEDNQQAIVSGCLLAEALCECGSVPDRGLGLIFVSDEETGNAYGIKRVLEANPGIFHEDDIIMVPDSGSPDGTFIEIAEKGILWLRVTVRGAQCHASRPDDGVNALAAAAEFITWIPSLEEKFSETDPLFDPPRTTLTPTKHEANVPNVNTMPGQEVFYIDCRVLPCYTLESVEKAVRSLGRKIAERTGACIDVEPVMAEPSAPKVSAEAPSVAALRDAVRSVLGKECTVGGVGGSTVAVSFREKGLPAVVWSTIFENCHAPNEKARISNAIGDAKVFGYMLFDK